MTYFPDNCLSKSVYSVNQSETLGEYFQMNKMEASLEVVEDIMELQKRCLD